MDPNLLSYFSVPNNQTLNPVDQNAESSVGPGAQEQQQQQPPVSSSWRGHSLDGDAGLADRTAPPPGAGLHSYDQASTAPSDISFTQAPMPSPYTQHKAALPTRVHPRSQQQRRRDGHDRKRTKVDPETATLESLDYWIQFDDEEADRTGSFEIDFSKRYDFTNQNRYVFSSMIEKFGQALTVFEDQTMGQIRPQD